jgi:hypothetical protein
MLDEKEPRVRADVGRHARVAMGIAGRPFNLAVAAAAKVMIAAGRRR